MKQSYSILIATEELLQSPAVLSYCDLHDRVFKVGEPAQISFLLPMYLRRLSLKDIELMFDSTHLEISNVTDSVQKSVGRLYYKVTIALIPKEIGTTSIGVTAFRQKPLTSNPLQAQPQYAPLAY